MRRYIGFVCLILLLVFSSCLIAQETVRRFRPVTEPSASERRVAIVLGNAAYPAQGLKNPVNDAEAMAKTLHELGFEVLLGEDLNRKQMNKLIGEWGEKLQGAQVALFYYSGHGMQVKGSNYLLPVDANPQNENDVKTDTVSAAYVLEQLTGDDGKSKAVTNLVILDACRTNPFSTEIRSGAKGLAKMEAPANTLIAYATAPGKTASDNSRGKNGLFTQELLKAIVQPGLPVETVFKRTRSEVQRLSKELSRQSGDKEDEQLPWDESSLTTELYLKPGASASTVPGGKVIAQDALAHLVVTSEPSGATVFIDKKMVGKTPYTGSLDLGIEDKKAVPIVVVLEGYSSQKFTATLEAGKETKVVAGSLKRIEKMDKEEITNGGNGIGGVHLNSSTRPTTANAGDIWVNPKDGAEMVYIPAGAFEMGGTETNDSKPIHTVTMDGYWMYKNLVTVGMYRKYCQEAGIEMPGPPIFDRNWSQDDHPIVMVSWSEAVAYCRWAGVSLPSEAQWEKAARGGLSGKAFPWGDKFDLTRLCSNAKGTMTVGSFPSNGYGLNDMAGNAWQWCSDWYDGGFYRNRMATERNPENQSEGERKYRVLRGGGWGNNGPGAFRCAFRNSNVSNGRTDLCGFRCASRP